MLNADKKAARATLFRLTGGAILQTLSGWDFLGTYGSENLYLSAVSFSLWAIGVFVFGTGVADVTAAAYAGRG